MAQNGKILLLDPNGVIIDVVTGNPGGGDNGGSDNQANTLQSTQTINLTGTVVARVSVSTPDTYCNVNLTATYVDPVTNKTKIVKGVHAQSCNGISGRVAVVLPDNAQVKSVTVSAYPGSATGSKPTSIIIEQVYAYERDLRSVSSSQLTPAGQLFQQKRDLSVVEQTPADGLVTSRLDEAQGYLNWSAKWHVQIAVTEMGIPASSSTDQASWHVLMDQWMDRMDRWGVPVTKWSEGVGSPLSFYQTSYRQGQPSVINKPGADGDAAARFERHCSPMRARGTNLFSMCQGISTMNTANPNPENTKAENPASFPYLASRGMTVIRQPYRWDRVERSVDGPLDPTYWSMVRSNIDAAIGAGMYVIIDPHCSWAYRFADEFIPGSQYPDFSSRVLNPNGRISVAMYVAHLRRVCADLDAAGYHGKYVIELTNEPHTQDVNAFVNNEICQSVVDAFRADGNDTHLLIPSFPFDSAQSVPLTVPWVYDPLGPQYHSYVVHHYFDYYRSGKGYTDNSYTYLIKHLRNKQPLYPPVDPPQPL